MICRSIVQQRRDRLNKVEVREFVITGFKFELPVQSNTADRVGITGSNLPCELDRWLIARSSGNMSRVMAWAQQNCSA